MSLYIDLKYINLLSTQLTLFKQKDSYLFNFRCPICGDSSRNRTKARGYAYRVKNDLFVKCHNCGYGATLGNFIKFLDKGMFDQYIMERYKNGEGGHSNFKVPEFKFDSPLERLKNGEKKKEEKERKKLELNIPSLSELDSEHFAVRYILMRQIPKDKLHLFYYAQDFKIFVNQLTNNQYKDLQKDDPRIVIPFYNEKNELIALQGRSLDKKSKLRYITIKIKDVTKIYGLERWNKNELTYIVEGPVDSLFLPNSLAMAGSDISFEFDKDKTVFVFDNEKRNKEIVKKMYDTLDKGYKIVIWPDDNPFKDINDMIIGRKYTKEELLDVLNKNTFDKSKGLLKLTLWKKVKL